MVTLLCYFLPCLADILFSLLSVCLSVCLCVCAHSVQSSTSTPGGYMHSLSAFLFIDCKCCFALSEIWKLAPQLIGAAGLRSKTQFCTSTDGRLQYCVHRSLYFGIAGVVDSSTISSSSSSRLQKQRLWSRCVRLAVREMR